MAKLLLLSLTLLLSTCNGSNPNNQTTNEEGQMEQRGSNEQQGRQTAITQGIKGKVLWESGNQMPSPDAPSTNNRRGIERTVYIYELTNGSQVTTQEGVFHTDIQTNLVAKVVTDADGNFTVSLKPGRYSLFTEEEKGLYANLFDGENNIFPVEVKEGNVTTVEFLINYNAYY